MKKAKFAQEENAKRAGMGGSFGRVGVPRTWRTRILAGPPPGQESFGVHAEYRRALLRAKFFPHAGTPGPAPGSSRL